MENLFELYRLGGKEISRRAPLSGEYESALLIEACFNIPRSKLLASGREIYPEAKQIERFKNLVFQRCNGVPLQYILGRWEFYGIEFEVGEGVLIPRSDTEILVDEALNYLGKIHREKPRQKLKVLDLCSGSGCIAISVAKNCPFAEVDAVEYFPEALKYLNKNIENFRLENLKSVRADVLKNHENFGQYHLILSNPPYIPTDDIENLDQEVKLEPVTALDGGEDGLIFYRVLAKDWSRHLENEGAMMVEIGINQDEDVKNIFSKKLSSVKSVKDLNGICRVVKGYKFF